MSHHHHRRRHHRDHHHRNRWIGLNDYALFPNRDLYYGGCGSGYGYGFNTGDYYGGLDY